MKIFQGLLLVVLAVSAASGRIVVRQAADAMSEVAEEKPGVQGNSVSVEPDSERVGEQGRPVGTRRIASLTEDDNPGSTNQVEEANPVRDIFDMFGDIITGVSKIAMDVLDVGIDVASEASREPEKFVRNVTTLAADIVGTALADVRQLKNSPELQDVTRNVNEVVDSGASLIDMIIKMKAKETQKLLSRLQKDLGRRASVSGSVKPAVSGSVNSAVSSSVKPAVSGSVESAVSGSVESAVSGSVESAVSGSVESAVSGGTDSVGSAVPGIQIRSGDKSNQ